MKSILKVKLIVHILLRNSEKIFLSGLFLFMIWIVMFVAGLFLGAEYDDSSIDQKYGDGLRSTWNGLLITIGSFTIICIVTGFLVGKYLEE